MIDPNDPKRAAYNLLGDAAVRARLNLDPDEASRLGLALVADADLAPDLAAVLLVKHRAVIEGIERQESYASAVPAYEGDELVVQYQIAEGTRRCLQLLDALRAIAGRGQATGRAA
jgi:hypothetical protein